jgi:pimeloyl-ACP methyl ester carboxylesterase
MKRLMILLAAALFAMSAFAASDVAVTPKMGIVIMHGKGGSPMRNVADLASALEAKGYLVANLDMPWSARRDYDASVSAAEAEVESALANLRSKGATRLFVAGHSQGGLFTLYFANKHVVDGIIAIAPGGNVGSPVFQEKLGPAVADAGKMIAEGKGNEKARYSDYEGSKGITPVNTTAALYVDWFNPEGAMNQLAATKNVNPRIPVLFIAPKSDHPGLSMIKQEMFGALPANPLTVMYEPNATHVGAPSASIAEIVRWTTESSAR